jgi:hypothetical protein
MIGLSEAAAGLAPDARQNDPRPVPAAAVIVMGMISLLIFGIAPDVLGALVDEGRLSPSGLGVTAMVELVSLALSTGLAGTFLKAENLRLIGAGASLLLAAINVATCHASGVTVFAIRALAGVPEGLLLWVTIGMIARSRTPERWAAAFFTARVVSELATALAFAFAIIPRAGADGAFATLALICLLGLPVALFLPKGYGPLPGRGGDPGDGLGSAPQTRALPLRGLIALAATVVYVSANGAVSIYLQPLAHRAGLGADVARTAVWVSLAAQILGGAAATAMAGRVRYLAVFAAVTVGFLTVWAVFGLHPSPMVFIGADALAGAAALLVGPFLAPMIIEADPSRRAAMQSGGAQALGGGAGPLMAALIVGDRDVHGVLWMGAALLVAGFAMIAWLHFSNLRMIERGATAS